MNQHFTQEKPVIYADVNVFRYLYYGELKIIEPENFIWAYSHIHLDEMRRGGNTDSIKGMEMLQAQEVNDVLDENFKSVGNVRIFDYVDPQLRYEEHLEAVADLGDVESGLAEHLLRIFGADNFTELSLTPSELVKEIDNLTSGVDEEQRAEIMANATEVSEKMTEAIDQHLDKRLPIDTTRNAMGLGSTKRKELESSKTPINEIWELIKPAMGDIDKDVFFGFTENPATPEIPHTQHGAIGGAHTILNLIGFSPDQGLAKRDKILNIMSDSQHVGMASYCQGLLSADLRLCQKANAIYQHIGASTKALHYQYDPKGCVVKLGTR